MLKIAPIDNYSSFYTLLSAIGHSIQNIDCSGFNIIRSANGAIKGVGYISNPTAVNAFVCDTSGNLWVGGDSMSVKDNYYGSSVSNAESMFVIPYITTTQPTAFSHADVSGCYDICPVRNLMMATVLDVSGRCHNWAASGGSRTVDNTVFPRIGANTAAFNMYTAPSAGGVAIDDTTMDLSGHRLVAFARSGTTGYDVSGFYVVRQNTTNANGSTASSVTGLSGSSSGNGIRFDISLNKMAFEVSRNKLYVGTNVNNANSVPLIISLDASANVVVGNYDISHNALFAYAAPTSTTANAVDGSGFMFVCTNPSSAGARPIIRLDASGTHFDTLTLHDVSGVNAMATVVASDGTNNYNYLFLVDASRNTVGVNTYNNMLKLALIKLSSRSENTGQYSDGSGVSFLFSNTSRDFPLSYINIRDIRVDANGNIFLAGHHIYTIADTTTVNEIADALTAINLSGASNIAALVNGAYTNNIDLLEAVDPTLSVTEIAKKIYKLSSTVN
jgi:hypothetical protein